MRKTRKTWRSILLPACLLAMSACAFGQQKEQLVTADSLTTTTVITDSGANGKEVRKTRVYNPRTAALRSAIIPGLGQIYNKKYWKLPIIYAGLGISGGVFVFNLKWYKRTRFAYKVLVSKDTANFPNVYPDLQFLIARNDANTLAYVRDQYRRDIDYSVLIFVLLWGLNVVDAAVDSHLKAFDVSPDLSLQFKPGFSDMANTTGLSLVLNIGKNTSYHRKVLPSRF